MYHYVRESNASLPFFRYLSVDNFRQQLDYFATEYGFISKEQFAHYLDTGESQQGIILTFDDGLADHYNFVLPELTKRRLWGIFFIPTAPLATDRLLNVHRVHYLLGAFGTDSIYNKISNALRKPLESLIPSDIYTTQTSGWKEKAVKYLFNYQLSFSDADRLLSQIWIELGIDEHAIHRQYYLTKSHVLEMQAAGMSIAAHSHNHPLLSSLSYADSRMEISRSIRDIKQQFSSSSHPGFCYPYGGRASYTVEQKQFLKSEGVKYCFSVEDGDISSNSDTLALPRYDCNTFPYGNSRVG